MAKDKLLFERAFIKALERSPLSPDELLELMDKSAVDMMEYGTIAECANVRMWVRAETYRLRAEALQYGHEEDLKLFNRPPAHTYPFYSSD